MSDHYTTLGVSRDVSPEDLKKAYRAKAIECHLDKQGGSHEAMAAVAHAYDILSDPEKRELYDRTGQDGQRPIEIQVQSALMTLFSQAVSLKADIPIIKATRESLNINKADSENKIEQGADQIERLEKKRGKVKVKEGKLNMVHCVIDQQIAAINTQIEDLEQRIEICTLASTMLDDYEEEVEIALVPPPFSSKYSHTWTPSHSDFERMVEDMLGGLGQRHSAHRDYTSGKWEEVPD